MSGLSKLLGPALAIGGSALLGSYLFPETTSYMTGGLMGSAGSGIAPNLSASQNIGPLTSGIGNLDLSSLSTPAAASIFSNPTVLSSGILAGTSLLSGLFGGSAEEEANKIALAEQQRQFDAKLALEQAQMAQALEIAKINAASRGGGGGGNGAAVSAQLKIAKANLANQYAQQKVQAKQIPLEAMANQMNAAQTTGIQSGANFNALAQILQNPALRSA